MNMKKFIANIMAICVVAGSVPFGTYISDIDALDFNIDGFVDEIISPDDIGLSYTVTIGTNIGDVKLNAVALEDNTLDIVSVKSLPSGMVDLVISHEAGNLKISSIDKSAFKNVKGIRSLKLGEGIGFIGAYAFADCDDIETIELPSTITNIGDCAFCGIDNLKSITVASGGGLRTDNGALRDGSNIFCYPAKKTDLSSYTVSSGIKSVRSYCFFFNKTLEKIILPESVERIYPYAFVGTSNCTVVIRNKDCIFYDDGTTTNLKFFDSTTTLCGYKGSTAETYAKENNLKFIDIEALSTVTTTTATAKTTTQTIAVTTVKTTAKTTAKTTVPVTTTVSTGKLLIGDANGDGYVNMGDVTSIIQHIGNQDEYGLSPQELANADTNGDGLVTGMDAIAIQYLLAEQIDKLPYIE